MRAHINALNELHKEQARNRANAIRACLGVIPQEWTPSWIIRDRLAEAWKEVFGEELTTVQAWNHIRFAMRNNLIRISEGKYFPGV
jgi:hypothetical protein